MKEILYVILGFAGGTLSGLLGIGGGLILIPGLVLLAGLTQHEAQGTTLALLLPPIGILAVLKYYQSGHVNLHIAIFVCLGFVIGALFGANIAEALSSAILRRAFGVFLAAIAVYMIVKK